MYPIVPAMPVVCERRPSSMSRARPKSPSLAVNDASSMTLLGLTSRCTTRCFGVLVERGADAERDAVPDRPCQIIAVLPVEMTIQAAIGHQLVDEEELVAAAVAPADELHEVAVPQPADDRHLGDELIPALS
ncbi:LOW QUALITY PROTEIN: hypothetical protein U9M48_037392 [Paspalum notatum var. saurae]|uniref:Uncharacterized protein n=1 Tax=Paspalum notatum var. saurae TaxID=547442 RepID=A0AAQ3UET2_PASNO